MAGETRSNATAISALTVVAFAVSGCALPEDEVSGNDVSGPETQPEVQVDEEPEPEVDPASLVPPAELSDCVEQTMTRAFLGDPYWGVLWDGLGQEESALTDWCTQFGVDDPDGLSRISTEWAAFDVEAAESEPIQVVDTADQCHPNYGGCVPLAIDVDCAGGDGDGPEYVSGPFEVRGVDVYGLDRDRNGVGCD